MKFKIGQTIYILSFGYDFVERIKGTGVQRRATARLRQVIEPDHFVGMRSAALLTASAICSHDDKWDKTYGRALAFGRMCGMVADCTFTGGMSAQTFLGELMTAYAHYVKVVNAQMVAAGITQQLHGSGVVDTYEGAARIALSLVEPLLEIERKAAEEATQRETERAEAAARAAEEAKTAAEEIKNA